MFNLKPGAKLMNMQIECALDGIHTSRNNTIENVFFRDVEEDAITATENVTIKDSQFWYCNDKCIQMNKASNVTLSNNIFNYVGGTGILANWGYNITVKNNFLYNAKRGIRSRTSKSLIRAQNNKQDGGNCFLEAEDSGILEDLGSNVSTGVKNHKCESTGGRIISK